MTVSIVFQLTIILTITLALLSASIYDTSEEVIEKGEERTLKAFRNNTIIQYSPLSSSKNRIKNKHENTNSTRKLKPRNNRRCGCYKLKQRVRELEAKLEKLLQEKTTQIEDLRGPKGEKGDPGPQGPVGPKGDRGYVGQSGTKGRDGYSISQLPKCLAGEYITSDGTNLMCAKLGNVVGPNVPNKVKTTSAIVPKSTKGDNGRREGPPPTIPAEMENKMTKFMKKYMIQTLYADAWDLHSFIWQQNTYLGISQLSSKTFTLYKWVQNVFVEKAILTILNARKWTSFEWEGNLYLVIACLTRGEGGQSAYSYVYKMASYDTIELFQKLETETAFGVDTIKKHGELFITFSYLYGSESDVFKWKDGKFVKDHAIPVSGTDIEAFHIGHKAFLAVVGIRTRDPYVYLLEYRDRKFVTFKNIPMGSDRPYGIKHIKAGKEHFLAVARYNLPRSVLLKWNGETFEEAQHIDSCKARGFATITTRQMNKSVTYMAVINFECKPVIYVYDEKSQMFIKLQQTDSKWTRDIEFLRMPNSDMVYLAVSTNRQTAIYAGAAS